MITPDSVHYINWTGGMCPLYPAFLFACKIFGPLQLWAAVIAQVIITLLAALWFNATLQFRNRWLSFTSLAILCAPLAIWGHLIGNDIVGYALMLCAFATFCKNKKAFFVFCVLATLTRFQYCFLFAGFLTDKRTAILAAIGVGLCFFCGFTGGSRLTIPANYVAKAGDISATEYARLCDGRLNFYNKPDRISHSMWFDKNLDHLGAHEPMRNPIAVIWKNRIEFVKLAGSKIYDAFRFHQLVLLVFLLALPFRKIQNIAALCMAHYAVVILLSSLYFQRYTFMIEIPLACCLILLYDILLRNKNGLCHERTNR